MRAAAGWADAVPIGAAISHQLSRLTRRRRTTRESHRPCPCLAPTGLHGAGPALKGHHIVGRLRRPTRVAHADLSPARPRARTWRSRGAGRGEPSQAEGPRMTAPTWSTRSWPMSTPTRCATAWPGWSPNNGGRGRRADRRRARRAPDRQTQRNGHGQRRWDTRVGELERAIPSCGPGSYFPSLIRWPMLDGGARRPPRRPWPDQPDPGRL
jgi:hypothetical protein